MRAALWTGVLVVLPGLWFFAQGAALNWFTDGEPPRLLRPLVRRLRAARRAPAGSGAGGCSGARCRSRCRPC